MHGRDVAGLEKLKERMEKLSMGARAFDRILRVARTIADLESAQILPADPFSEEFKEAVAKVVNKAVLSNHISEAIGYRNLDRSDYGTAF